MDVDIEVDVEDYMLTLEVEVCIEVDSVIDVDAETHILTTTMNDIGADDRELFSFVLVRTVSFYI